MICPKCRKKYPDGVTVCPDCEVELIGLLGSADAPMDDGAAVQDLFEEIVVDKEDKYSPIVYKVSDKKKEHAQKAVADSAEDEEIDSDGEYYEYSSGNPLAVAMLIFAILFLCASGVMFFLGKRAEPQQTLDILQSLLNLIG